jgi:hypothetical protein
LHRPSRSGCAGVRTGLSTGPSRDEVVTIYRSINERDT